MIFSRSPRSSPVPPLNDMQIELVSQPDAIARWQKLVDDPELARWPGKIETDRFGRILMSPPPAFGHTRYAGKIIRWLNELLPSGQALPETPVLTADGIEVPDVTWIGPEYFGELEANVPLVLERVRKTASKCFPRLILSPK